LNDPIPQDSSTEVSTAAAGVVFEMAKAELDQQIVTAKRFPRSIKRFVDEATAMVTLNESIAGQCIYAIPRDGKTIEGPSARFAEIMASAYGNCRAGAAVISEGTDFIVARGTFFDLERNAGITVDVQRRITDSRGRRYKPDMIGVTGNAANSIALRNAILKGVPKAFWEHIYQRARAVIAGDFKTLANRRAAAVQAFVIFGVTEAQLLAKLGRAGIADVSMDDLVTLHGMLNAIKDGDSSPEQLFADDTPATSSAATSSAIPTPKARPAPAPVMIEVPPVHEQSPVMDETRGETPIQADIADSDDLSLATVNEKRYLAARAERLGTTIEDACAAVGVSNFERLSADGFIALKEHFAEVERERR
jgi:hypothetical protein